MAKKITAYSCEYKCARNVLTSKSRMLDHEAVCFYNPINRACATCKFLNVEVDDNGMDNQYREHWVNSICLRDIDVSKRLTSQCNLHETKPH